MSRTELASEPWFVNSLAKGMAVLQVIAAEGKAMSTTEIAKTCGLSRAAARRFLLTLADLGYLRLVGRSYLLTARTLDLGYGYLSTSGIVSVMQPLLDSLSASCGETASIAILDGLDVVYVARTPTKRMISLRVGIGSRIPIHASALGKAILAFMPPEDVETLLADSALKPLTDKTETNSAEFRKTLAEVRRKGFAVAISELEYGVISIAVPLLDGRGKVAAAMNISTQATIVDPDTLEERYLSHLRITKQAIEAALLALPNQSLGTV